QLIVFIEPTEKAWNGCQHNDWQRKQVISVWLQCTRLAVDLFVSPGTDVRLTAWITELMTGIPVNQAIVSIRDKKEETNQQGLCTISNYKSENNTTEKEILIVQKDNDLCILTDIYSHVSNPDAYVWHVFNDRNLYKPKEDVHIKGYVRLLEIKGDEKLPTYAQGIIDYTVYDPRGEKLQQSKVELNNYG
ncbi:unnamed protein product, partial [Adineta steineri]